jgi:hypothetical protein
MTRSNASLFMPALVLVALAVVLILKPWQHLSVGGPTLPTPALATAAPGASGTATTPSQPRNVIPKTNAPEATLAASALAVMIRQLEQGTVTRKLVDIRCTRASAWPQIFGSDAGDAFDCQATFTTTRQPWCALFNPSVGELETDYQGPRMCEGPPNATIEP